MSGLRRDALLLALLLAGQLMIGAWLLDHRAQARVLPPPPTLEGAFASALGDGEFFFRNGVLKILNVGVTGGELVPMKELDYGDLSGWFLLLDRLDSRSIIVPYLASYWYGFTPNRPDARYVIDYLLERAAIDPLHGWEWRVVAMYLAQHRLQDLALALEIAEESAALEDPEAPYWVAHMPAFLMEGLGEREAALILLVSILETKPDLSAEERDALTRAIVRLQEDTSGEMQ